MDVFVAPSFYSFYQTNPLVFIDVGSRGGIPPHWVPARAYLDVVGFEPDTDAFAQLNSNKKSGRHFNIGLYNQATTLDLYVTREGGDSSLLKPNADFLRHFPQPDRYSVKAMSRVQLDTLDHVLEQNNVADADFIKIDTQGTELFILQGARQTLNDHLLGLEIEVEFAPIYCDQPRFNEIDRFVSQFGFELFDMVPVYWKRALASSGAQAKGQIIYADVLYLAGLDRLEKLVTQGTAEKGKSKVLHLITSALVYGYQDYALEISQRFANYFSATEQQALASSLESVPFSATTPPNFPGKRRLVRALERLLARLNPPTGPHWRRFGSGKQLGNLDSTT